MFFIGLGIGLFIGVFGAICVIGLLIGGSEP